MNESQENGIFHDDADNGDCDEEHRSDRMEWDINKLFLNLRQTLKKTLDSSSSSLILNKLIINSENKISSQLNKLESYLYSIERINNKSQCEWLLDLGVALINLFHQIECNYHDHPHHDHQVIPLYDLHPPQHPPFGHDINWL